MPRHRIFVFSIIPGLLCLAGQSVAAPTIPLPEPGSEPGLMPALAILGLLSIVATAERVRPLRTRSDTISRRWVGNLSLCVLSNGVFLLPTVTAFAAAFVSQSGQRSLLEALELPSPMRSIVAI